MRAVVYTRGNNVNNQFAKCKEYAERNGYKVSTVASTIDDLASLLVNTKVDVLLVSHITRLTRKYQEFLKIEKMLQGYGVRIEIANNKGEE